MAGLTGDRKLAIRPFQPGEQVKNTDGSYSTERTVTVPTREGGWTVVPSLWMGPNGPVDLLPMGDDFIADVASKYERQSGQAFPKFRELKAADQWASQRSKGGGADQGALAVRH